MHIANVHAKSLSSQMIVSLRASSKATGSPKCLTSGPQSGTHRTQTQKSSTSLIPLTTRQIWFSNLSFSPQEVQKRLLMGFRRIGRDDTLSPGRQRKTLSNFLM